MRRFLLLIGAAMMTAGCVSTQPVYLVHKTGSTSNERKLAFDMCEFEAIREVPRAMAVHVSEGYYNPGTVQCSTIGSITSCNNVGAVNIPSTSTTYDANAEIRHRYIGRCLERKGYSIFERPLCRTQQERQTYQRAMTGPQPPASEIMCVE